MKLYLLHNRLEPKKDGEGYTQVTFLILLCHWHPLTLE
jgi:hypothetical protein